MTTATKTETEVTKPKKKELDNQLFLTHLDDKKVTEDEYARVIGAIGSFLPEATLSYGHKHQKQLMDDKSLDQVQSVVPLIGKDAVTITTLRKQVSPNPQDTSKPFVSYGATGTKLELHCTRSQSGELAAARKTLKETGLKLLGE